MQNRAWLSRRRNAPTTTPWRGRDATTSRTASAASEIRSRPCMERKLSVALHECGKRTRRSYSRWFVRRRAERKYSRRPPSTSSSWGGKITPTNRISRIWRGRTASWKLKVWSLPFLISTGIYRFLWIFKYILI